MTGSIVSECSYTLPHITLAGISNNNVGKPILLALHGWLDNANSFIPMLPYFDQYHVIALDWAGHGKSSHRPHGVDYQQMDYVYDLHALITEQGWNELIIVGHSMGGILASLYASAFPENVKALVSLDAYGPLYDLGNAKDTLRKGIESRLQRALRQSSGRQVRFGDLVEKRIAADGLDRESAALILSRAVTTEAEQSLTFDSIVQFQTDPRLRSPSLVRLSEQHVQQFMQGVSVPTLAILASDGLIKRRKSDDKRQDWFANVLLDEVDGHHHVHMQRPQQIAAKIADFLAY